MSNEKESPTMLVSSLQSKIEKLVHLHKKTVEDNMKLTAACNALQLTVAEQQGQIDELKQALQDKKGTLEKRSDQISVSREEMQHIVREVEHCLCLLQEQEKNAEIK